MSPWFPFPATNGARRRSEKMLTALRAVGHRCHLFCLGDGPVGSSPPWLETTFAAVTTPAPGRFRSGLALLGGTPRHFRLTFSPATLRQLDALVEEHRIDAVVGFELGAGYYLTQLASPRPARILDGCEPFQFLPRGHHPREMARVLKFKPFLRQMLDRFDVFTTVSDPELAWLNRHLRLKHARGRTVPNGTDLYEPYLGVADTTRVIYTGSITYHANREAVEYFLRHVWPAIREAQPDARFVVTGELPPTGANGVAAVPGVTFAGILDDYPVFVRSSGVLTVPLLSGGGTRIKILEALALGCPVVASPKAIEGLDVVPGKEVLVAHTPAEFATAVLSLMRDRELRQRLVESGRQAARRYDWAHSQRLFVDAVESAASMHAREAR